jgi:hypothetical protein
MKRSKPVSASNIAARRRVSNSVSPHSVSSGSDEAHELQTVISNNDGTSSPYARRYPLSITSNTASSNLSRVIAGAGWSHVDGVSHMRSIHLIRWQMLLSHDPSPHQMMIVDVDNVVH